MPDISKLSKAEELLFRSITDSSLIISLLQIRDAAEKIWAEDVPRIIKDYTDHSIKHSIRVAEYAVQLLKANRNIGQDPNKPLGLSQQEMYLLLASIYLHDIGMQRDVVKAPDGPEIKDRAVKLGAQFDIKFTTQLASQYSLDEQKAIRKNHQYLSAAWIDYSYETRETALGLAAQTIPDGLVGDLIDVCLYHTKLPITECQREFEFDQTQHKQLVAALLRFSDELDIAAARVSPIEIIKDFSLSPQNSVYWWLHKRTNVVFPTPNVISLTIRLHPNDANRYASFVEDAFINEFQKKNWPVMTILGENNIPIVISYGSKVVIDRHADPLPSEIIEALQAIQVNIRREVEVFTNIELAVKESTTRESPSGEVFSEDMIREVIEIARELAASPQQVAGANVLWVGYSVSNTLYERSALAALGIQFTISMSIEDALEKLQSNSYDAIIYDMKNHSYKEAEQTVFEELRKMNIRSSPIIYEGSTRQDFIDEAIKQGRFVAAHIPQELFRLVVDEIKRSKVTTDKELRLQINEIVQLEAWNFLNDYKRHHHELVTLARTVYGSAILMLNAPPTKVEFSPIFKSALLQTTLYNENICGRKMHLPPSLYSYFAELLARYVLEHNWAAITRTPHS